MWSGPSRVGGVRGVGGSVVWAACGGLVTTPLLLPPGRPHDNTREHSGRVNVGSGKDTATLGGARDGVGVVEGDKEVMGVQGYATGDVGEGTGPKESVGVGGESTRVAKEEEGDVTMTTTFTTLSPFVSICALEVRISTSELFLSLL